MAHVTGYFIGALVMGVIVIVASIASGAPAGILAGVALILIGGGMAIAANRVDG